MKLFLGGRMTKFDIGISFRVTKCWHLFAVQLAHAVLELIE
jgi:hypothetical protein